MVLRGRNLCSVEEGERNEVERETYLLHLRAGSFGVYRSIRMDQGLKIIDRK